MKRPAVMIDNFAQNLFLKEGVWYADSQREVSYSKEGHTLYYQIEDESFWFQYRNKFITEVVRKYSAEEIFFDIGGGNGFVTKGLTDNNIESVLVEPGINGVLNAQKRGLQNIICSTFQEANFKKGAIQSLGIFDVIEHIEDDSKFLQSIHYTLGENGILYITVPAFQLLWSEEDVCVGHYRRYTIRKMRKLLEKEGFDILYSTYFFSLLPIPIFLFRAIPSFFKLRKSSNDLKKYKKEHFLGSGFLSVILGKIWNMEERWIRKNKKIPFGSSCLFVAKKREK